MSGQFRSVRVTAYKLIGTSAVVLKAIARKAPGAVARGASFPRAGTLRLRHCPTKRRIALPEEGLPAPDFTLRSDAGEPVTLSSLRGSPVVLYFYPKDDTPGCSAQARGIRDA
jgi:cytochrome oxidase Cu insertion factor (SCO1/SenC/PrrC family)